MSPLVLQGGLRGEHGTHKGTQCITKLAHHRLHSGQQEGERGEAGRFVVFEDMVQKLHTSPLL